MCKQCVEGAWGPILSLATSHAMPIDEIGHVLLRRQGAGEIRPRGVSWQHQALKVRVCVVAEVATSNAARPDAQVQWPVAVVVDGVRYPVDE